MTKSTLYAIINIEKGKENIKNERKKIKKLDEIIKALQEIKKEIGNVDCYGIDFFIETDNEGKTFLTI